MQESQGKLIRFWFTVWLVFTAFFENMAQQPLIAVFSVSLGGSAALAGLTVSIYSLFNIGGNLLSPWVLRNWGSRLVLSWGMLTIGLTVAASGLSQTPVQLILLRILHGLVGGLVVPVVFVNLSAQARRQHYGGTMARGGIAIAIAATIGPVLAGFINQQAGFFPAFATIGALLLISGLGAFLILPPRDQIRRTPVPWRHIGKMWSSKGVRSACRIAFSFMAALGIMAFRFPLYGQELGLTSGDIGMGFGVFSLCAAVVMWPAGHFSDRWGRKTLLLAGMLLSSGGMLGLSWGQSYPSLLLALGIHGIGFGTLFPVTNALLLDASQLEERGAAFGLFHGFFSLGVFSGPLLAVALLSFTSPFHVATAILLATALVTAYQLPSQPASSPKDPPVTVQQEEGS